MTTDQVAPKPKDIIVNFVLDESSSMTNCCEATISAFNEYVQNLAEGEKKDGSPKYFLSLTKFNTDRVDVVCAAQEISKVSSLNRQTYVPAAMTPLYDAIGRSIEATGDYLSTTEKDLGVLCVILTDGEENSSKEFTRDKIFQLIKKKESEGWQFLYLGTDHDAWKASGQIGIVHTNTASFRKENIGPVAHAMSIGTQAYASSGARSSNNWMADNIKNPEDHGIETKEQEEKADPYAWTS